MKTTIFIIPFNSLIDDVCDYSTQTMRVLSEKGYSVFGVALGNPLSLLRNLREILNGEFLIKQSKNYLIFRPIMFFPLQRFSLIKKVNLVINIFLINLLVKSNNKVLWFFEPKYSSLFLNFLVSKVSIFDCVDYFPGYENLKLEHNYALKKADLVFVNSKTLQNAFSSVRKDIKVVPLGFYSPPLKLVSKRNRSKKNKVIFIGGIGSRIDFSFVKELIDSKNSFEVTFVGPLLFSTKDRQQQKDKKIFFSWVKNGKVIWKDKISKDKITKLISQFDVGLIPYKKTIFNLNSFPMKVMEYFYVGLPVISTTVKELSLYPNHVYFPESAGWQNLAKFLKKSNLLTTEKRKIALKNSWEKKVTKILNNLS